MLVLSRKIGNADQSKITVFTPTGDKIVFCALSMKGNSVQVGIEAPKPYTVIRNELLDKNGDPKRPLR